MRLIKIFLIMVTSVFASISVESYEETASSNLSIPVIALRNDSDSTLNGFIVYYYFSSARPADVRIDDYFLMGGTKSIETVSGNVFRVKLDYSNISLASNSRFPASEGLKFGMHYADYANWNILDDYSNNGLDSFSVNNKIVVQSADGSILFGEPPITFGDEVGKKAKVYIKSESSDIYGRYRFYVRNEGLVPLSSFSFDIFVKSSKEPILEAWYLPNTSSDLSQLTDSIWKIHFSTSAVNVESGDVFPDESGFSIGIHNNDYSSFDTEDDYSLKNVGMEYHSSDRIPVYVDGLLIYGVPMVFDISDIKTILANQNGFTVNQFDSPLDSLELKRVDISRYTLASYFTLFENFLKDVPNFDSSEVAFYQILNKFYELDTMFLAINYSTVKSFYETLVQKRMENYLLKSQARRLLLRGGGYGSDSYEIGGHSLTSDELWLYIKNPMKVSGSKRAMELATEWTSEYLSSKSDINKNVDNRVDAYRHSVWNALLCQEPGTQFDDVDECLAWAKEASDAHETEGYSSTDRAVRMDYHNNGIGRLVYRPYLRVACEWSIFGLCINHEVVGASRDETKMMYRTKADAAKPFNEIEQLDVLPWANQLVFFRDDDGKIYCSNDVTENCKDFIVPTTDAVRIGLLKRDNTYTCEEEISFYLDLEDDDNDNRVISGSSTPPGISLSSGGVTFTYCVKIYDGENGEIPKVGYDYAVLRLDENCPKGTYPFRRRHDTEDDDNNNSYSGNIWPNEINDNAKLEYCFVPADEKSKEEFPFEDYYGVFANKSSNNIIHSEIKLDDEDDDNNNSWFWYNTPKDIQNRIQNIMNGSSNTICHVIKYIEYVVKFFKGLWG